MSEERLAKIEAEIAAIRLEMAADIPYPWETEPEATHAVQNANGQVCFCTCEPTPNDQGGWFAAETFFSDGERWHFGPKLTPPADYTKTLRKRPEPPVKRMRVIADPARLLDAVLNTPGAVVKDGAIKSPGEWAFLSEMLEQCGNEVRHISNGIYQFRSVGRGHMWFSEWCEEVPND